MLNLIIMNFVSMLQKWSVQHLSLAETKDVGLLCKATDQRNDEHILLQIKDKGCVAIEVRYHKMCCISYTQEIRKNQRWSDLKLDISKIMMLPFKNFVIKLLWRKL